MNAGGYGTDPTDELVTGVNITPVVDVMLVLLIVFLVTSSLIVSKSIQVEVPRAATGSETAVGLLALVVAASGELYVNGQPARVEDIPRAVAEARKRIRSGAEAHRIRVRRRLGTLRAVRRGGGPLAAGGRDRHRARHQARRGPREVNQVGNTGVQGWGVALVLYAAFFAWVYLAPPARRDGPRPQPTRVTLVDTRPPVAEPPPPPPPQEPPRKMEVAKRSPSKTPPAPAPLLEAPRSAEPPPVAAPRRFAVSLEATVPGGGIAVPTAPPGSAPALRATPGGTSDRADAPAYYTEPDSAPSLIAQPDAAEMRALYPDSARRAGLEGDVRLELEVSASGEVTGFRVVRSAGSGFDEVAQRLVRRFRFRPATRGGKAVPATVAWTYKFRLEG